MPKTKKEKKSPRTSGAMHSVKCVVVGDNCDDNKTKLIVSYMTNSFPGEYIPTVFDNYSVNIMADGQATNVSLSDTTGQEDYDRLRPLSYPQTDVFILTYDVNDPSSLQNVIDRWNPEISSHCPNVPKILVGTGIENGRIVSIERAAEVARMIGAKGYAECSSLSHDGLKEAFDMAIKAGLAFEKEPDTKKKGKKSSRFKPLFSKKHSAKSESLLLSIPHSATVDPEVERLYQEERAIKEENRRFANSLVDPAADGIRAVAGLLRNQRTLADGTVVSGLPEELCNGLIAPELTNRDIAMVTATSAKAYAYALGYKDKYGVGIAENQMRGIEETPPPAPPSIAAGTRLRVAPPPTGDLAYLLNAEERKYLATAGDSITKSTSEEEVSAPPPPSASLGDILNRKERSFLERRQRRATVAAPPTETFSVETDVITKALPVPPKPRKRLPTPPRPWEVALKKAYKNLNDGNIPAVMENLQKAANGNPELQNILDTAKSYNFSTLNNYFDEGRGEMSAAPGSGGRRSL